VFPFKNVKDLRKCGDFFRENAGFFGNCDDGDRGFCVSLAPWGNRDVFLDLRMEIMDGGYCWCFCGVWESGYLLMMDFELGGLRRLWMPLWVAGRLGCCDCLS
jgi:hypothetical protein